VRRFVLQNLLIPSKGKRWETGIDKILLSKVGNSFLIESVFDMFKGECEVKNIRLFSFKKRHDQFEVENDMCSTYLWGGGSVSSGGH
jgi:hypothetical protein